MQRIAVLMACYNRKDITITCLNKLFSSDGICNSFNIDVFLVDDASTDGTKIAVNENFPMVNIIIGDGKLFWNRGMHLAWKEASRQDYDFYLWLNNDTLLYSNAICTLLTDSLINNHQSIICGSVESPIDKGVLTYGGGNIYHLKYVSNYPDGKPELCSLINGNCVLIPKYVFLNVGYLDWTFVHAIGDNDYSLRAKRRNISSFTSSIFVGSCSRNEHLPSWCLPSESLLKRIKSLYSPLGNSHPIYYFIYENRHFGLFFAIKHFISIHLRLVFPQLWR